jgi:hypothetical protein
MPDIQRREFIALVGGGGLLLTAKVRRVRAQQPAIPVIGFLSVRSPGESASIRFSASSRRATSTSRRRTSQATKGLRTSASIMRRFDLATRILSRIGFSERTRVIGRF